MNSAGLSSICQGTNGLNGSALRAILSTCGAALTLALAPDVGDAVPVPVCVHAPRSSAAMAAHMTGHPVFRANMNLSLQRKADADDRVEFASASPRACACAVGASVRIITVPRARWPLYRVPQTLVRR